MVKLEINAKRQLRNKRATLHVHTSREIDIGTGHEPVELWVLLRDFVTIESHETARTTRTWFSTPRVRK